MTLDTRPDDPLPPDVVEALEHVPREPQEDKKPTARQRALRIIKLHSYESAVRHAKLTELRQFDLEEGWRAEGATSCAQWMAMRLGDSDRTARAHLAVAHALPDYPRIDREFARGRLSYTQVRALVRHALPETEGDVIELGLNTSGTKLEKTLKFLKQQVAADLGEPPEPRLQRVLRDDGLTELRVLMRPETTQNFDLMMRAVKETACGRKQAGTMQDVDAFDGAIDVVLESKLLEGPRAPIPGKYEAVVSVDAEVLKRQAREPGERCEVQGTPITAATALRLTCDAPFTAKLVLPDGKALDVSARARRVPRKLMVMLLDRDRHCRFPGCVNRLFLDAHHMKHWAHGGETTIDNLVLTCRRHHRVLHEGGFTARMVDGQPAFFDAGGARVPEGPPTVDLGERPAEQAMRSIRELGFGFSLLPRHVMDVACLRSTFAAVTREVVDRVLKRKG